MKEIWKDINGYEDKYQVSTLGNVRSLNYNNTGIIKELKQKTNRYGYKEVKLSKNNITKDFLVSTLVAQAFIPNPYNKPYVMHISNKKIDNSVENLKWAYISEIKFAMYKTGNRKGKPSKNIISYKGKAFESYSKLAKANNVQSEKIFFKRIYRDWSLEDALDIPKESTKNKRIPRKFYEYYGENLSVKELAKRLKQPEKIIRKRLSRGWTSYECEIPLRQKKERN